MKHAPARPLRTFTFCTLLAAAATGAAASGSHADAIGQPGVAAKATRTVQVDMTDAMRFTPADVQVKQGETVRFVVKNSGQLKHELVLGTAQDLKAHYEAMKKHPEMEHAEPNMVTLAPGKTGEVVWQFTKAGKVDFGCLQPGHYDAGMKGAVTVAALPVSREVNRR
ncbi:cupredoxin family protein [Variovorax sp. H27-G14]|uniref:cupredoxin domain-containing protein n=1 Tax=Variovorax sp. H27-G14 TaxID=3111914 RepID=UPI0038FC1144